MNKLVSIVMSTYKTDKEYLDLAIESILNQTYKNIEFIIVCDGDIKEFNYIKDKYEDERIRLILHETNKGLPKSLNEGIRAAKGEYIARMDSDDISLPNRIKTQIEFMEKHQNLEISGMHAICFGKLNKRVRRFFIKPAEIEVEMLYSTVLVHPSVMFRKKFFDKNIFYNEEFLCSQDKDLWSRAVNHQNIAIIPKYGIRYRIHNKQAGIAKHDRQIYYASLIRKNTAKKLSGLAKKEIYNILEILNDITPVKKDEILNVCKNIDKIIDSTDFYDKKISRNVFYNRIFILIIKYKLFSCIFNKHVFFKFFNFINLKYIVWRLGCIFI